MAGKYFLVTLVPKPGVSQEDVQAAFDLAEGWYRFSRNQWIIYDDAGDWDAEDWHDHLIDLVRPDGKLFVCRAEPADSAGFMTNRFWKWLKAEK